MEPPTSSWLHGFARLIWHHLAHHLFVKPTQHPYESTMRGEQCNGATESSVAPRVCHADLASFDTPFVLESKATQHPYGSTIKYTQCNGAPDPSVDPWVRHANLASFGTPFVWETKTAPVWVDHKMHTML